MWVFFWTFVLVVIDQFSKYAVTQYLSLGESKFLINSILHITLVHNKAAAFGLFKGYSLVLILISILVIFYIAGVFLKMQFSKKRPSQPDNNKLLRICLCLILSGAVGNLIDRLRFGYVIDFLDIRIWPVFNIADSAITIGSVGLVWFLLRSRFKCTRSCSK